MWAVPFRRQPIPTSPNDEPCHLVTSIFAMYGRFSNRYETLQLVLPNSPAALPLLGARTERVRALTSRWTNTRRLWKHPVSRLTESHSTTRGAATVVRAIMHGLNLHCRLDHGETVLAASFSCQFVPVCGISYLHGRVSFIAVTANMQSLPRLWASSV
jgi:hypothetical protein